MPNTPVPANVTTLSSRGPTGVHALSVNETAPQLDRIEAAGLKLMRIRGIGGRAQFIGKRMRKAA